MREHAIFDKIDLHLIRVPHTVLTKRSVSRAALRQGTHQPAVSACLKRLREFAQDPLLVRAGSGMVPTEAGMRMVEPSASILCGARTLFVDARGLDGHLERLGLQRNSKARVAHLSLIPAIVASSLLVLTTGRTHCGRFVGRLRRGTVCVSASGPWPPTCRRRTEAVSLEAVCCPSVPPAAERQNPASPV